MSHASAESLQENPVYDYKLDVFHLVAEMQCDVACSFASYRVDAGIMSQRVLWVHM